MKPQQYTPKRKQAVNQQLLELLLCFGYDSTAANLSGFHLVP